MYLKLTLTVKIAIVVLIITLAGTGCASSGRKSAAGRIAIAEQYGLAYAPLQVMKELKLLEENLPGVKINWKQLGNTAAIREAMLANEVDIGFMAIPPFLIGWDKGMSWKIACGLSSSPVGLVTNRNDIKTIKDFTRNDRIALPQPGSVQHILLSMECEKVFGDSHKLDDLLVTMAHPDGMNALLAKKEVTAHFTSPPYLFMELEVEGMKQVLSGKEVLGKDFTFIVGAATETFHRKDPEIYNGFMKSLDTAVRFINNNPEKTAAMLSKVYGMDEKELLKQITWEGMEYSLKVKGIKEFAGFMKRNGYISREPEKTGDVFWEDEGYEE